MTTQTNADSWEMMRELGRCEPFIYGTATPKTIDTSDSCESRCHRFDKGIGRPDWKHGARSKTADAENLPRAGEVRLKDFLEAEAKRRGITPQGVDNALIDRRPIYAAYTVRRVNGIRRFVKVP